MNRQNKGQRNFSARGSLHPPQFQPTFTVKKKLRFQAKAASTGTGSLLLARDFGDLWCVATTTTSASQLAEFFRVKKIEMWGPMSASLVPVTVSVDWPGSTLAGVFGKSNRVSDTSMGSTEPAHLVTRPPPGSQIAEWLSASSAAAICSLVYPLGTIIDMTYEIVVRDDATSQPVLAVVAGAIVGANYIRSLDNTSVNDLSPVSYSTI